MLKYFLKNDSAKKNNIQHYQCWLQICINGSYCFLFNEKYLFFNLYKQNIYLKTNLYKEKPFALN